jgi:hypothetical protein
MCSATAGHLRHDQTEKSTVQEHIVNTGHEIQFEKPHKLKRTTNYLEGMVKEATEIKLHPNNFSREGGFTLS